MKGRGITPTPVRLARPPRLAWLEGGPERAGSRPSPPRKGERCGQVAGRFILPPIPNPAFSQRPDPWPVFEVS
jgi:hypothetical protein